MKDIGKIIESRLQAKNMTQTQLGEKLGLNQRTISQYVRGNSMPSLETLSNICNLLDINISYILETNEYNNTDLLLENKDEIQLINHFRTMNSHDKLTLLSLAKILNDNKN